MSRDDGKRDFKDEMADLLFRTQMPLNVQREYLKKVSQDSEMDTRERLEAEIRYEYNGSISNEAEQIIEWLDRQAAITRTECKRFCDTCMDEQVDELQAQVLEMEGENEKLRMRVNELWGRLDGSRENVEQLQAHADELTNQLDNAYEKNRSLRLHISKMQSGRNGWLDQVDELHAKLDALEADRNVFVERFEKEQELRIKLEIENGELREKLSRAYDNAHDTLRTM